MHFLFWGSLEVKSPLGNPKFPDCETFSTNNCYSWEGRKFSPATKRIMFQAFILFLHICLIFILFFQLVNIFWLEDNYFTIMQCFCHISAWISHRYTYFPPSWTPSPPYPSELSQSTNCGCLASCIELALVICFTYGTVHISMLFSQIIPPSPSPTESKSLLFTSVSPLLPHM